MVDYTEPRCWKTPSWHHDYGDVQGELDHLRNVAQVISGQIPQFVVGLSIPEDGLMFVVIATNNGDVIAEIYSLPSNGPDPRRYGVFSYPNSSSEEEQYSSDVSDVVGLLKTIGCSGTVP
jgi:hypothetical protein